MPNWELKEKHDLELANSSELHLFLMKRHCPLVGCFYGHEANDYCVCCGQKRPMSNLYGKEI